LTKAGPAGDNGGSFSVLNVVAGRQPGFEPWWRNV
jgi:hypothetical protein